MQPRMLKYILDIESVIQEIELIKAKTENDFNLFLGDIIFQRAIERDLEIVGEAVKKILALNPEIQITSAKNIIGLRNIIAHAYDAVEPEMLWAIIQKNIPVLAKELESMKNG